MSFAALSSVSLSRFIEEERRPDALWFFVHIPKTAGTSVSFELDRLRPPYVNVAIDYHSADLDHDAAIRQAVERFRMAGGVAVRSASGHVPVDMLDGVFQSRPGSRLFTILRDPLQRLVSDYAYQTTPAHPPFADFKERFPRIEDYVLEPSEQNKMFRFLSGTQQTSSFDAAYRQIEQRFSFIGVTELYDMSFNIISQLMGYDALPVERRRRTSAGAKEQVILSATLVKLIRQANHLDQQLYSRVVGSLLPKLAEWEALPQRRR